MVMWLEPGFSALPSLDTDMAMFNEGHPQPAAPLRTFMRIGLTGSFAADSYDWSRIVAVYIDEPYGGMDPILKLPDNSPACTAVVNADIAPIDASLSQRATELKSLHPKVRFWVNFTQVEANWMAVCEAPQVFNRAYIDVISADWYYVNFSSVQPFYTVVSSPTVRPKPDQQLALVPGTFHRTGNDSPLNAVQSASLLQGYFDYANNANQSCNLPLGSRGITGIFDGCPVWIVMGWLANTVTDGQTYFGELDPTSAPIAAAWRAEVALPLRPDLIKPTPAQMFSTILPVLLD